MCRSNQRGSAEGGLLQEQLLVMNVFEKFTYHETVVKYIDVLASV